MGKSGVIRAVDVFDFQASVRRPVGPSCATYTARSGVVVRIESNDGAVGWGETYARVATANAAVVAGAGLVGADACRRRALTVETWRASGDSGVASAFAMALDDLYARQLGVRVADLYGGTLRETVFAYASSGGYRDDIPPESSWEQEWEQAVSEGFRAAKFRIGRFDIAREAALLERLRRHAGDDAVLMVDANGAYDLPSALRMGAALAQWGYTWFEEPLSRHIAGLSYAGYTQLRGRVGLPVAGGEGLAGRSEFDSFMTAGKADIVQPDVAICGGIAETLLVADLAQLHGMQCVPHAWGGAILLAATLQVAALLPPSSEVAVHELPTLEIDRFENPLRTELVGDTFALTAGRVTVPCEPGLGIEVDEEFLHHHAVRVAHHTQPNPIGHPSDGPRRGDENDL